jgi:predicted MFS family arabinose efflux permease
MMFVAPAIMLVVLVSILRQAGQGIQSSFYVVYLEGIGMSATLIGSLLSVFLLIGASGALAAGSLARLFNPYWLLMVAVALTIILIAITPLLGGVFLLLALVIGLRGGAIGVIQPVMLSLVAKAANPGDQGKGVAVRATANRLAMTVTPVVMGATAELAGIENAFYLVGAVLLVALAVMAVYVRRTPVFRS